MSSWKLFRNMFIKQFEKFDVDQNLFLEADELTESLQDL